MAKKKTPAAAAPARNSTAVQSQLPERAPRDASPDMMESLKTLNHLLLKETMERREQLAQLRAHMDDISADHALLSHLHSDVARLLLSSALADAEHHLRALAAEKAEAEASLPLLLSRVSSMSDALGDYEERLVRAAEDKDELRKALDLSIAENDASRMDLGLKLRELEDLQVRASQLELSNASIRAALEKAKGDNERLAEDGKAKEDHIRSLIKEKESIESRLADSEHLSKYTEQKMEEMVVRMQVEVSTLKAEGEAKVDALLAMGEDHKRLKEANHLLEEHLHGCREAIDSLERQERELQLEIGEMGERNAEASEEIERLRMELGAAAKEKEERDRLFESRMHQSAQQIDALMAKIRQVGAEMEGVEQQKAEQKVALIEAEKEFGKLRLVLSELQESCLNKDEANAKLRADHESVLRELNAKRDESSKLGLQLGEMKKSKDEVQAELRNVKAKLKEMEVDNEVGKRRIELLMGEKASLEEHLVTFQSELEVMEKKVKAVEMNAARCLSMLKHAGKVTQGLLEGQEDGAARDIGSIMEVDEEVRPFAAELELIMVALRTKEGKIEALSRDFESLQCAVAAQKKRGLWTWLYPATTTALAAISFAYAAAARGH